MMGILFFASLKSMQPPNQPNYPLYPLSHPAYYDAQASAPTLLEDPLQILEKHFIPVYDLKEFDDEHKIRKQIVKVIGLIAAKKEDLITHSGEQKAQSYEIGIFESLRKLVQNQSKKIRDEISSLKWKRGTIASNRYKTESIDELMRKLDFQNIEKINDSFIARLTL